VSLIVVGASGYIGSRILSATRNLHDVLGTSSAATGNFLKLNLNIPSEFDYEVVRISDVIFLTAAISAPDICAREHNRAWAVNVTGTSEFICQVMARGGRVIFFSSDTVYGEGVDEFDEKAACNPAGEYAEMKYEVEKQFLGNPLFKTIRLSYVFSHEDKFTNYLIDFTSRDEEAELFRPFYRAIVYRDDVVEGALALAKRWDEFPQQVINFGGPEVLSRIDFAECLKRVALPNLRYRVTEPGDDFFKNRPRIIAMSSNVLPDLLGRPSRSLLEAAQIEFASS
jgi:nucleoside-diphosphate-sugar epimerase